MRQTLKRCAWGRFGGGALAILALVAASVGCGESIPPEIQEATTNIDDAWVGSTSSNNLKLLLTGLLAEHSGLERSKTILGEALTHSNKDIRMAAMDSLVAWDDPGVAEMILPLAEDSDELVRRRAARALAHYGSDAGKDTLLETRRTQDGALNLEVCGLLNKIGDTTCAQEAIKELGNKQAEVREAAAAVLGDSGGEDAIEALRAALGRQRGVRRSPMIEALGECGDASDVARVGKYARYRENVLSVIRALGGLGDEEAQKTLATYLDSEDPLAKLEAAGAMIRAGVADEAVVSAVESAMERDDLRYLAAKLLSPSVNEQTDRLLASLAGDEDLHTQAQAMRGLLGREGADVYAAARDVWERNKEAEIYEGPNPPMEALLIAVRGSGDEAKQMLLDGMESQNWAHILRGSFGLLEHTERGAPAS